MMYDDSTKERLGGTWTVPQSSVGGHNLLSKHLRLNKHVLVWNNDGCLLHSGHALFSLLP